MNLGCARFRLRTTLKAHMIPGPEDLLKMDQHLEFMETCAPYLFYDLEWPKGVDDVKAEFEQQ